MSACKFPGKLAWIETNTPFCDRSMRFYRDMFCWDMTAIHVDPWGILPELSQGGQAFGNGFMAMGLFARSKWVLFLAADFDSVEQRIEKIGGTLVGKQAFPGWSRMMTVADPLGHHLNLISLEAGEQPEPTPPGMPMTFKIWHPNLDEVKQFYANLFEGIIEQNDKNGTILVDGVPRFHLADLEDPNAEPIWVPYFRTRSLGADARRATTFGAIPRNQDDPLGKMGRSSLFVDPAGSFFGLLQPAP